MTADMIQNIVLPIVCGMVPIGAAVINTRAQRRQELISRRLDVYCNFESAFTTWVKNRNFENYVPLFDAGVAISLLASKNADRAAQEVISFAKEHPGKLSEEDIELLNTLRVTLVDAMRKDLKSSKLPRKHQR